MRSIYRDKKHSELIEALSKLKDPRTDRSVFPTVKALQCYAAVLGFDQGRRQKFDQSHADNIEWHTFNNDGYTHYIYLIALAETKDIEVLRYDEENSDALGFSEDMVKIFEEYANGGFNILHGWLNKTPGDPYGSKAIIAGLQREGYLSVMDSDETFDPIEF